MLKGRNQTKMRSPCRYIADSSVLSKYHARPLLLMKDGKKEENEVIGIQISSWCISTEASTIAHQHEIESLTQLLETLANEQYFYEFTHPTLGEPKRKRRLSLPESVYIHASVDISNRHYKNNFLMFSFDVTSALSEWSMCHNHLTHYTINENNNNYSGGDDDDDNSYRGVSILKSIDASLWSQRIIPTDFNYDWTFSTPYCGTTTVHPLSPPEKDHTRGNTPCGWIPYHESGIDMTLLTDQSIPILYYDEIKLFEDDMHDNGYTSLTCKIRVMPTCLLCLMTLFVRVDYVLVRMKEVRIFIQFHNDDNVSLSQKASSSSTLEMNPYDHNDYNKNNYCKRIWKEIIWRECPWNQLVQLGLPNHIQAWRFEDNRTLTGKELQLHQQKIQSMIRKLPLIPLPSDLSNNSYFQVDK